MALDSDVNAADQALHVEIYDGTVRQNFLSEQAGRPIYHDAVFIRIQAAGDKLNIIDRPIEENDKRRFPLHWAHYQNQTKDGEHPGTPLSELPGLTKAGVLTLKASGFHTVEQFAAASDGVLQTLGMSAGVSPTAFRDQCKRFLGAADEAAPITKMESELAQRDAEIAAMKAQIQQLIDMQTKLEVASVADPDLLDPTKPAIKPKLGLGREQAA